MLSTEIGDEFKDFYPLRLQEAHILVVEPHKRFSCEANERHDLSSEAFNKEDKDVTDVS